MKKLINYCAGTLISVLCVSFVGCNEPKETELQGVDVPFTEYVLSTYAPSGERPPYWVNLDYYDYDEVDPNDPYKGKILLINSDEEMKKYLEDDYSPVDFSTKTLVLAYGRVPGGFSPEEYKFQQVSEQNYVLTLNGYFTILPVIAEWYAAIIVDKLPSNSKIEIKTVLITKIN